MKYDLHIHSNISDGKLNRNDIAKMALSKELKYICFTEHNTFDESSDLKQKLTGVLKILNGIEFDTSCGFSFHTLCYFNNYDNSIDKLIELFRQNTNERTDQLLKKISNTYNINLSIEYLMKYFNSEYITKREVIDWLVQNEYANTVFEAAGKYTNKTASTYVPKYSLDFDTVVSVIKNLDGKILLAHPITMRLDEIDFEKKLVELINKGLDGIEIVNSSKMKKEDTLLYYQMAKKYKLLTSGGSDFHNMSNGNILGIEDKYSENLVKSLKKTN